MTYRQTFDYLGNSAINWTAAALLALILASAYHLDGPTDHSAELAQAADLQAAIKTEAQEARFAGAAAQVCGNAGWALQPDGSVRCVPRKGHAQGAVITVAQVGQP